MNDDALERSARALDEGRLEEGIDALVEAGLVAAVVVPNGNKRYELTDAGQDALDAIRRASDWVEGEGS